ncbi:hypothetical protein LOZ04_005464 [Ophidiomyces ophidiicola]|nr:hypothetical protein LOZ34_004994 [Ophidiomyces ophidiicola]KAI2116367.1 hypothetical protein LOZ42_003000 [Ophidiomyces ophidiicola]KAI2171681.1 hypothetical protein LOZ24_005644 [Ophidiomyces ophidiicola]KAI2253880.1 hypothetical protein LOZ09_004527 [Ophidiomyces ophidiicola]KAI2270444.1 hypothetical protein LOZ04_005464 [Ophidiomyces ophidiicola]
MVSFSQALYLLSHPQELRSIIQWYYGPVFVLVTRELTSCRKVWHEPVHARNTENETETEKKCYHFLKLTSRSFSAVIMELHPELLLPVCLFYLILRGLDTIEDDTSISLKVKEPLLRDFQNFLEIDGWTFDGNRPEEKDRELLVQFHNVITEFKKIKPAYKIIIKDITNRMGNGMADYCRKAEVDTVNIETVEDYDLYCWYVAGLVGEGLTRLFVEAGFARPQLLERPELYKSMGLLLQKTNIIRDVREDEDDNRRFWPKEIWSNHVDKWEDLFKLENREAALNCGSEMVLNALGHVEDCLYYLAGLKEQSVFNFCAIPQSMAIATLELCLRNSTMFDRNIKITKGQACQLMWQSTQNVRVLCDIFRQYARAIHKKNTPKDPNFLKISMACGKIEKFIESIFPSQSAEDAQRRLDNKQSPEDAEKAAQAAEARRDTLIIVSILFGILVIASGLMFGVAWMLGARFDIALEELKKGNFRPPGPRLTHGELSLRQLLSPAVPAHPPSILTVAPSQRPIRMSEAPVAPPALPTTVAAGAGAGAAVPNHATPAAESPPRLRAASACVACNKKKVSASPVFSELDPGLVSCGLSAWWQVADAAVAQIRPRERKRKRRKIAVDRDDASSATTTAQTKVEIGHDIAGLVAPRRSNWDSSLLSWDQRRPLAAEAHPPAPSEASAGARTSAQNQTPPTSAFHESDGPPLYPTTASSGPPRQSQPQDSRAYGPSTPNSTFLGRSEYIRAEIPFNEYRGKPYSAVTTEYLTEEDLRILHLQHAFDLPPRAVRDGLIDTFMKRCAPWMPIVERSWLTERSGHQPSILLLQAIFLAASRVSSAPAVTAYASSNDFYRRARALFWSGYEKNTITVITSVCILHWYNPEGPEHVSINTSGFWNRIGVGLAYQIGLHKEPPPGRDALLKKRLWWTLYARDCLISAGHGRPRAINPDDSDVKPLTLEDFYGSSSNGQLFVPYVEISALLGELTQCYCRRSLSRQKRVSIENALYRWTRELPEPLRLFRKYNPAGDAPAHRLVLMPYDFEARQLHVPYFITLAILYRPTSPSNLPSAAAILASSFIAGIFEDLAARDEIRFLGPVFTFYLLAAGVGLLSCFPYPHLWERAEQDLRIIYNSQKELAKRYPSAIGSLKALQSMLDDAPKVARPSDRPQPTPLTPDQQACFSGFGTDLCRLGDVMLANYPHDMADSGRPEDDQYARTVSDMMTAGILAELKTPMDAAAALDEYLPLATVVDHNTHLALGGDAAEITDEMMYNQYDGIGNWLLRDWDWNTDFAW